ncbi:MAG: Flp pilus assembly complex ATPase component TadA [Anaerotruncus sp.]|nr:Flp pilus assembly complex ATPase component TadA [Anaerotruncus sp.]
MKEDEKYTQAISMLSERVQRILERVPQAVKASATEIRLRVDQPLSLYCGARVLFVDERGNVSNQPNKLEFLISRRDLQDNLIALSGWSVHTHQREMTEGYLAVRGGHRAGVAASAVLENGRVSAIRDVTSLNLRIAREVYGAADQILAKCFADRLCGVLLAGAPASGKTTILRDLARQLSSGVDGAYRKVCVVDESGEIGGAAGGNIQNDLGPCCDLLAGYPKAKGLQIAVRYLSPQVLFCDEICTPQEVESVALAANSGVAVVTSIHASSFAELMRKPQVQMLLETGAFTYLVLLCGAEKPAQVSEIRKVGEIT